MEKNSRESGVFAAAVYDECHEVLAWQAVEIRLGALR
jgi:hypothetical protein